MANNYIYIVDTGLVVPDTSDILATVQAEYQTALGDDLDLSPNTPQGMLIATETNARTVVIMNNTQVANQINPDYSGGVFLDAIGALTKSERDKATRSVLQNVEVSGIPGTPIPEFSRARIGQAGAQFETTADVTLDPTGNATVEFRAIDYGPVLCGIGDLDTPVAGGVLGWEAVSNPAAAIVGQYSQSDASFRFKRRRTLAKQTVSLVEAQVSGLYDLDGVRSLQFRENIEDTTQTIDGIVMGSHSVWACVAGGTNLDIATSLLNDKSNGARWTGATVVPVVEPASGQTYNVKFDRPTSIAMQVRVTLSQGLSTADPAAAVPQAVVAYANGDETVSPTFAERAFRVGVDISPFEIASAVDVVQPGFIIRKVEIASVSAGIWSTNVFDILTNQEPTITLASVLVVIV